MTNEPATPEHDKFRPHQEDAQTIVGFLEWMSSEGIRRMIWGRQTDEVKCPDAEPVFGEVICVSGKQHHYRYYSVDPIRELIGECPKCNGTGYVDASFEDWIDDGRTIPQLIADFFGIDKKKFDEETEAVYQYVSAMANKPNEINST